LIIVGAIVGCILIVRSNPYLSWGLTLSIVITALFSILYPIPDRDPYFLPALPAVMLGWVELLRWSLARIRLVQKAPRLLRAAALIPLIGGLVLAAVQYRWVDKSEDDSARRWARAVLDSMPQDALLLTRSGYDSEIYALWHEQIVYDYRSDVTVFGTGFLFSGWYRRYFEAEGRPWLPLFIMDREPGDKFIYDIALAGGVILPNLPYRRVFAVSDAQNVDAFFAETMRPRPHARVPFYTDPSLSAYQLNPPGRLIIELDPTEATRERIRRAFVDMFGAEPPGRMNG
jgi:hypothetical protein